MQPFPCLLLLQLRFEAQKKIRLGKDDLGYSNLLETFAITIKPN